MIKAEFIQRLRELADEIEARPEHNSIQHYNVGGYEARLFEKDGVYGEGLKVTVIEGDA